MALFSLDENTQLNQAKLARNHKILPFEFSRIVKDMKESSIGHIVSAEITYWPISAG